MVLLEVYDLEKSFGERKLFNLNSLKIYDGDRVGIVGQNGAGKTTLLNILAGVSHPDKGQVRRYSSPAVIPQLDTLYDDQTGEQTDSFKTKHLSELNQAAVSELSGGEQTRLKITKALNRNAKLLFADEPTSHLDIKGIKDIEKALQSYHGAVIMISHDRSLLNSVCTKIIEIESGEIKEYKGNYDGYVEQKQLGNDYKWFEYENHIREKARLMIAAEAKVQKADQLKAPSRMGNSERRLHKGKARGAKGRLTEQGKIIRERIDRLDIKEKPKLVEKVQFDLNYFSPINGKTAIQIDQLSKSFDERMLFEKLNLTITPGEKVALIGENGCGKSTLIKMIKDHVEGVSIAGSARVGYYAQNLSLLEDSMSILETVVEKSRYPETFMRTILARLLFKREDVYKKIHQLSGGERAKVALAKIFLGDYNLLLLDEPTNYLDIFTQEQLEAILAQYPGTIVFASHDRRFINGLCDKSIIFEAGKGPIYYRGTYEQYEESHRQSRTNHSVDRENDRIRIENEISVVIGRLSSTESKEEKEKLEIKFQDLLKRKSAL